MDIYLIRHGKQMDSFCNEDVYLSETGRRQAMLTGKYLQSCGIDALYASDLKRTGETAEIIDSFLHLGIKFRPDLREICFGELEGRSQEYIDIHFGEFNEKFYGMEEDLTYPGGECGMDVIKRAMPVIEEIAASDVSNAAVVAHGGTIRAILCHVLGVNLSRRILIGAPLGHGSISIMRFSLKKGWCVHSVNSCGHLDQRLQSI